MDTWWISVLRMFIMPMPADFARTKIFSDWSMWWDQFVESSDVSWCGQYLLCITGYLQRQSRWWRYSFLAGSIWLLFSGARSPLVLSRGLILFTIVRLSSFSFRSRLDWSRRQSGLGLVWVMRHCLGLVASAVSLRLCCASGLGWLGPRHVAGGILPQTVTPETPRTPTFFILSDVYRSSCSLA